MKYKMKIYCNGNIVPKFSIHKYSGNILIWKIIHFKFKMLGWSLWYSMLSCCLECQHLILECLGVESLLLVHLHANVLGGSKPGSSTRVLATHVRDLDCVVGSCQEKALQRIRLVTAFAYEKTFWMQTTQTLGQLVCDFPDSQLIFLAPFPYNR